MPYKKETPRLEVHLLDGKTGEVLFKVSDRNHMNISDFLSDQYLTLLIEKHCKDKDIDYPNDVDVFIGTKVYKV